MYSLSENLNKSWAFFVRLFDDISKTIILIIFQIIPVVNFIVLGYGYEIIRQGDTIEEPPPLDNLGDLFFKGLKVFIVALIYFIIPVIVVILILGTTIFNIVFYQYVRWGVPLFWVPGVLLTAYAAVFLIGLAVSIIAIMGIIHFIKTGDMGKAFAFNEIMDLIKKVGWDTYLPWVLLMYIACYVIFSLQNWVIQAILSALFTVFFARSAHYIYPAEVATPEELEEKPKDN